MDNNILFLIVFVLLSFIVAYFIVKSTIRNMRITGGIVNHDTFKKKFVFRVDTTVEDFIRQLNVPNVNDVMEYTYFEDSHIIVFNFYGTDYKYRISIDGIKNGIILMVEQVCYSNRICNYINPFWMKKFNAVPLDYELFAR